MDVRDIRGPTITIVVKTNLSNIGAAGVPNGFVLEKNREKGNTPCLATSRKTRAWPMATEIKFPKAESATKTGRIRVPAYVPNTAVKNLAAKSCPDCFASATGTAAMYATRVDNSNQLFQTTTQQKVSLLAKK